MTPVMPPIRKITKKHSTQRNGVVKRTRPPQSVAIQQKNCAPVGIAIMMLAAVKKLSPSCGRPVANMWWTHSPKPMNAVPASESTTTV